MRFQRYPDGADKWTWFIWGRHPKGSLTWTHSLSVSLERKGAWNGPRKWLRCGFATNGAPGHPRGFYWAIGRLHGRFLRQHAFYPTHEA